MRLRVIVIAAAASASAASAAPAPHGGLARPPADCPYPPLVQVYSPGRPALVHKLTDLPPANLYLSVYRRVDGCVVPVIAAYGLGATGPDGTPRAPRRAPPGRK